MSSDSEANRPASLMPDDLIRGEARMSKNINTDQADLAQDRLRDKAYELWEDAGSPDGHAEHFWHMAEREVKAEEKDYDKALMDTFPASDPPAHSGFTS
jgi:hypothetical protein